MYKMVRNINIYYMLYDYIKVFTMFVKVGLNQKKLLQLLHLFWAKFTGQLND